ncbi:MAG TPA: peptidase M16 [Bacteroidetes bacterium]|nr:peptidase M16 [Bacteroidota bacterium]
MKRPIMHGIAVLTLLCLQIAGTLAQYKPLTFTEYDLPNGLHVILHEDHSAPVVATVLHYKVGSRDEDPARTGFAHFFEHLMFESTEKIERASIDKMVNGAGGELNAFTSNDQTVYHFVLPSNQVRLGLWIEAQRMRKLNVNSIGVETQRGVVKEERKNRYDNAPYGGWLEKAQKALYAGTPYEWSPIGSAQHIDSATIEEFKSFYDQFYQPNNAILVVSGDFDEKLVRETIDAYFGGYQRAAEPKRPVVGTLEPLAGELRETVNDPKAQLPAVFMAYRSMPQTDADVYAADLLTTILSNGESSRMYRALVDSAQVAVQASVSLFPREYIGMTFCIGIVAPGKNPADVEKGMDAEIERLIAEGVSEEELTKAKNITEMSFVQSRTGVYQKALALSNAFRFDGGTGAINDEMQKYMKVNKDDIKRVAKRMFGGKQRIVLTYLPSKG